MTISHNISTLRFALAACSVLLVGTTLTAQPPKGRFTAPVPIAGLESPWRDQEPTLINGGLTIFFNSDRPADGDFFDPSNADFFTSTRPTASSHFPEPVPVASLNVDRANDNHPKVSEDGTTIYFSSDRGGVQTNLYVARRDDVSSEWGVPVAVAELNSPGLEFGPSLAPDLNTIYFASTRLGNPNITETDLFVAERGEDGTFAAPEPLASINSSEFAEKNPSISNDGLTLFFDTPRGPFGFEEIWAATRNSLEQPFGSPMSVNEVFPGSQVNSLSTSEFTPFVSPDWPANGSKLYFARAESTTGWNLYESTWLVPEPSGLLLSTAIPFLSLIRRRRSNHAI